jgi:hypothetical protein
VGSGTLIAATREELDDWVVWYQGQGFGLRWYQPPAAMLVRTKRLSAGLLILCILVGWIFIWIPLFIYLVVFAFSQDEVISIRVAERQHKEAIP